MRGARRSWRPRLAPLRRQVDRLQASSIQPSASIRSSVSSRTHRGGAPAASAAHRRSPARSTVLILPVGRTRADSSIQTRRRWSPGDPEPLGADPVVPSIAAPGVGPRRLGEREVGTGVHELTWGARPAWREARIAGVEHQPGDRIGRVACDDGDALPRLVAGPRLSSVSSEAPTPERACRRPGRKLIARRECARTVRPTRYVPPARR